MRNGVLRGGAGGHGVEGVGPALFGAGEQVAVAVQRGGDGGVAGSDRDLLGGRSGGDPQRDGGVAEVVEPQALVVLAVSPSEPTTQNVTVGHETEKRRRGGGAVRIQEAISRFASSGLAEPTRNVFGRFSERVRSSEESGRAPAASGP
jgi:hypothetical protein